MAGFSDIFTAQQFRKNPLTIILTVNTIIFLTMALTALGSYLFGYNDSWRIDWLSLSSAPMVALSRPWTAVTYMFTHYEFVHFLFNMLWLWWFGVIMLITAGNRRFTFVYFFGGLAGAAAYLLGMNLIPGIGVPGASLCGASAAVMAVTVATAIHTPDFRVRVLFFGDKKIKWMALIGVILVFIGIGGGNYGGQLAHAGGLMEGIAAGLAFRRKKKGVTRRNINAVKKSMERRRDDTARLNQLLDKISTSGYASLSKAEKKELAAISERLDRKGVTP